MTGQPVQEALFGADKPTRGFRRAVEAITPREWPGGVKPWDPIDKADEQLGWEHPYVDHRRAVEIRLEIEAGRRDCYELAGPPPRPIVTVHLAELS